MKKQILVAGGIMLGVVFVFGLVKYFQISAAIAAGMARKQPPTAVTTLVAQNVAWPRTVKSVGALAPVDGAMLSAEEMGRVASVNFESGERVEKDKVLVALDTSVEQAQLDGARARLKLANLNAERQRSLRERNANAKLDLDTAEATLKEAKAEVERLNAQIRRKKIIAPFTGQAGIRLVNVGQTISVGTDVVTLQTFDPLYVNFSLPQSALSKVEEGSVVEITSDALPGEVFKGKLTVIEPAVNSGTRTFNLQALVPNPKQTLRAGMFVDVKVLSPKSDTFVTIPTSSISYAPYGNTVYVLEPASEDGTHPIRPQIVKLGEQRGDQVAVLSGIKPGEQVATSGVFKLRPGISVIVNNEVTPGNDPNPKPSDT